ncbi:MAG: hypothetical protein B6D35_12825 [Candidatus Brocadia sp. UTAMX2]|jgi:hypothetical protein|nr:MAG: hypothetical protein B6D35_12825 [Candidatus Brocadia sp. UTAMX2]
MMVMKNVFAITAVFALELCLFALKPTYAISLELSTEQIAEAVEYGQKNKRIEISLFSKPWTICKEKGLGTATLFTPFHNIAYKARKFAVEQREFTQKNIMQAAEIGDAFTFSVTVYGDEYDFCVHYTAKLYYKDDVIQPEFEFTPDIAEASEFWPDSPSHSARLVFKFPTKDIDLNGVVTLAVVAPGGEETVFDFDLSKMK